MFRCILNKIILDKPTITLGRKKIISKYKLVKDIYFFGIFIKLFFSNNPLFPIGISMTIIKEEINEDSKTENKSKKP